MIEFLRRLLCNRPAPTAAPRELPLDEIFAKYGEKYGLPPELLHALAYSESKLNPRYELDKEIDVETRRLPSGAKDTYWGLFQVGIKNVLEDWNEKHEKKYRPVDLFDPEVSAELASNTLRRIATAYEQWADMIGIPNMIERWNNIEFVRLVIAGWNSGYSRGGGVQRVAKWLSYRNIEVTHDNVFKYAARAGGTRFLDIKRYKKKWRWQRRVVDRYFKLKQGGKL